VITLTDDLDPNAVQATYRDGVPHISIRRRETTKPRRINVT
jgi:HSP20 family protein